MLLKTFYGLLCVLPLVLGGPYPNFRSELDFRLPPSIDWWKSASFYQIYPRSFKDGKNWDGIGDLVGIADNLAYLKELGIDAVWISPIFKSPMKDFGYDISDYYSIQEEYGTMEDFENMIKKANELGIKIILDFVPNHTSDENEWFQKSIKRDPQYENFYIWHPGKINPNNPDKPDPPTNWISVFRGSAWKWNDQRKEYYLHQFSTGQPDLNYREPKVQEAMEKVLRFWLGKGAYGFRIDAVPFAYECKPPRNEPRNPDVQDPDDYGYLFHSCTTDQDETLELVYKWRAVLDDFTKNSNDKVQRIMMTEAYSPIETVMKYYQNANGTKQGAHIPFNFMFITKLNKESNAHNFVQIINEWLTKMPPQHTANWVMGNHDQHRVANRFGDEKVNLMNIILLSLPGVSITYYGEEIGMTDVHISWEDTKDPVACHTNKSIYERYSRDPERTPFQWSDGKNAGFSTADKTWLPISPDYTRLNVRNQEKEERSVLNIYKAMQKLRKSDAFQGSYLQIKALSENVLGIMRSNGYHTLLSVVNLGNQAVEGVSLHDFNCITNTMNYKVLTNNSPKKLTDLVLLRRIDKLIPYEGVVIEDSSPYFKTCE